MKPVLALIAFALLAAGARADWRDLKPGMDPDSAWRCAGVPLLQNKGKGGNAMWTYDRGGYIIFERGRVAYWEQSQALPARAAVPTVAAKPARRATAPTVAADARKVSVIAKS